MIKGLLQKETNRRKIRIINIFHLFLTGLNPFLPLRFSAPCYRKPALSTRDDKQTKRQFLRPDITEACCAAEYRGGKKGRGAFFARITGPAD
ncbi:hypothetical protein [Mixta gaviniae]|uniref:hypothetical protein n=1 Tax=Mixta gaviniae TaxID=665914 RepID=UPI0011B082F2|nr:hypothetical protein [Mixta gaviniae]